MRGWVFDLCLGVVGKMNRNCEVSDDFFRGPPRSLTAINVRLDEME